MTIEPILAADQCGTVARKLLAMDRTRDQEPLWHFGVDRHGAFITDRAFLAYVSPEEQAAIMTHWGLLPGEGTWHQWDGHDATDTIPVPDVAAMVDAYTMDDPLAEDTALERRDDLHAPIHYYLVGDVIIPIDAQYYPLLAGCTVRMHGPLDRATLWTADRGMVDVGVMRVRTVGSPAVMPMLMRMAAPWHSVFHED